METRNELLGESTPCESCCSRRPSSLPRHQCSSSTQSSSSHSLSRDNHHKHFLHIIIFLLLLTCNVHISSCSFIKSYNVSSSPTTSSHTWKAEIWGACYSATGCGDGQKSRTVICTDENGLKVVKSLCDPKLRPKSRQPCFKVCQKFSKYVSWKIGDWGECQPSQRPNQECIGELRGIKTRKIECVFQKNEFVKVLDDIRECHRLVIPQTRVACIVPCPQNCIVTKFSDWISCDGKCGVLSNRTRIRTVLVAPKNGGRECPKLIEMTDCNEARAACLQSPDHQVENKLRIGPWNSCRSEAPTKNALENNSYSQTPDIGYQIRSIECRNSYGATVAMNSCKESAENLETRRPCIVSSDCVMSSWGEWIVIRPGCASEDGEKVQPEVRVRHRIVLRLPEGNGKRCPFAKEQHNIKAPKLLSNCNQHEWLTSEWSECLVIIQQGQYQVERRKANCSGGLRQRNVTCVHMDEMRPVESHLCTTQRPLAIKQCNVSCKQACEVSQWTSWSHCRPPKSPIETAFSISETGHKERYRFVKKPALAGGLPCPALNEVEICDHPSWYKFVSGNWQECVVTSLNSNCGPGLQKRTVRCLTLGGDEAAERLCKFFLPSPTVSQPCYVPCLGDCVLSPWTKWSHCSRICSDDAGSTGLRFRNRTVLAYPASPSNHPCPDKNELKEEEACNNHNCIGIHWQTKPWRQCKAINLTASCVKGKQKRKVYCLREGKHHASDKKCANINKPAEAQPCTYSCPQDCQVTKFSEWSSCPTQCPKDLSKISQKHRRRFVIKKSRYGGIPCPKYLIETQNCSMLHCFKSEVVYEWKFGDWSLCEAKSCRISYRTRAVGCVSKRNGISDEVEPHFCLNNLKNFPQAVQKCAVTCKKTKKCFMTAWSNWSPCNSNCGQKRIRTRSLIQGSEKMAYCKRYHLREESKISCPLALIVAFPKNDWLQCISYKEQEEVKVNGLSVIGRCGVGNYSKKNNNIIGSTCMQTGIEEEMCINSCPFDCKMRPWTEWSPCSTRCGIGYRTRLRVLISQTNFGGRLCPHLIWENQARAYESQIDVCVNSCTQYKWQAFGWSQCDLESTTNNALCGFGHQSQTIRCMKMEEGILPQEVEDVYCDPLFKPESRRQCEIPCADKCVLGEWSTWTDCNLPCNRLEKRERSRVVLRQGLEAGAGKSSCPEALVESDKCVIGENCFSYSWNISTWSSCLLPEGAFCGEGRIRRGVSCQRSDNRTVDSSLCGKAGLESPRETETWCFVDCPIDCEVSQWSEWNSEECNKCGLQAGYLIRSRKILMMNSSTGQKCPDDLVQRKPCHFKPCYYVEKSLWSACSLKNGECGHGTRQRNMTCRRSDGHIVDLKECLLANITDSVSDIFDLEWLIHVKGYQEKEDCFSPCQGDCVMSEWSPWSHCHRNCENGEEAGFQTKSRAILAYPKNNGERCPDKLYQTKPCIGGRCVTFQWKVISKRIVCSSSDNVLVIGGCEKKPLPCVPKCSVAHSTCTAAGLCACRAGYKAMYERLESGDQRSPSIPVESHSSYLYQPKRITKRTFLLVSCRPLPGYNGSNFSGNSANMSADGKDVNVKFYPDENEFSFWMYGMIAIGTSFIIFVSVTIYLMCHSKIREHFASLQDRMRRRPMSPRATGDYPKRNTSWQQPDCSLQLQHHQHPNYLGVHKMDTD